MCLSATETDNVDVTRIIYTNALDTGAIVVYGGWPAAVTAADTFEVVYGLSG